MSARLSSLCSVRVYASCEENGYVVAQGGSNIMTTHFLDGLSNVFREVRTKPLFVMRLDVKPLQIVGAAPAGFRRVGVVTGGTFAGDELSGRALDGADWQIVRSDGGVTLDVRLMLETHDKAMIAMTYRGLRTGPADVLDRLNKGEAVDPTDYYFRIAPLFETAAPRYAWLNDVVAVGVGHRYPEGPLYAIHAVL
jgi:hypothetical protein